MSQITDIVDRLNSSEENERLGALEQLDHMGTSQALDLLIEASGDERWHIRRTAIDALLDYPERTEVIETLIRLFGESNDTGRCNAAIEVLTKLGANSVPHLLRALTDPNARVRKFITDILGQIADARAEEALIKGLEDSDENVRMAAAEALGEYSSHDSHEALIKLLHGPDLALKFCAMQSLAKMGREIPLEEIEPLVKQSILRRAAFDALGTSTRPEATAMLIDGLNDSSRSSRNAAIRSLGRILDKQPAMRDIINDSLAECTRLDGILDDLLDALSALNPEIKRGALRLLALFRSPKIVPHIIQTAREPEFQADAINTLKEVVKWARESVRKHLPPDGDPLRDLISSLIDSAPVATITAPTPHRFVPSIIKMSFEQFSTFRDFLHDYCGIYFKDEMKFIVEKRLLRRLDILGIPTFAEYIELLVNEKSRERELWEAIGILTTNETYFFREKFQLKAFSEEILPLIKQEKTKKMDRTLRVWSAGCSSGEEPYTIAILIDNSGLFPGWDVQIVGSDISERVIKLAQDGIYRQEAFRTTPEKFQNKYFHQLDKHNWRINEKIHGWVQFSRINLRDRMQVKALGRFDLIFCRNVIIYFDISAKRKVIETLNESLVPGGYLLLGHSESLVNISTQFDLKHLENDMVYRKPLETGGVLK